MGKTFTDYVHERVLKNRLPINVDECVATIDKYADIYPGVSEIKRFFYYVKNKVGGFLADIDEECADMFGMVEVRGKTGITFFEFVFDEDYHAWQTMRLLVYQELTDPNSVRMLNYAELSTMNMITDISTRCMYELFAPDRTVTVFNKTGYGTDQDAQSFIKFISGKFNDGYSFKPVKPNTKNINI